MRFKVPNFKNYEEISINQLFLGSEDYIIYDIKEFNNRQEIYLKTKHIKSKCPKCGRESDEIKGSYTRIIQDIPINGKTTYLIIKVYTYICRNTHCKAKSFSQSLDLAHMSQRRTDRLDQLILALSLFMSFEECSRTLEKIGVIISADAISRLWDRIDIIDDPNIEEIGVDDLSSKKGLKYLTAIYSIKTHHLIALLDGRDGHTFREWLKTHPKIKKVVRDRSSEYAAAITQLLPEAIQIADRFHLFQNLITHLQDIFYDELPDKIYIKDNKVLNEPPKKEITPNKSDKEFLDSLDYDCSPPVDENGNEIEIDRRNIMARDYKESNERNRKDILEKQKLIREVQAFRKDNPDMKVKDLAEHFNISRFRINRYLKMSEEDIKFFKQKKKKDKPTKLLEWSNLIYKMTVDGYSGKDIFYYIIEKKNFTGNQTTLANYICHIRANNFTDLPYFDRRTLFKGKLPEDVICLPRDKVLRQLLTIDKNKMLISSKTLKSIFKSFSSAQWIQKVFLDFHKVIMEGTAQDLDDFIDKYEKGPLESFINGIKKDILAVKNSISFQESSGFVEGNNNKVKLIKRIVYGKSSRVNLEKRCQLTIGRCKDILPKIHY